MRTRRGEIGGVSVSAVLHTIPSTGKAGLTAALRESPALSRCTSGRVDYSTRSHTNIARERCRLGSRDRCKPPRPHDEHTVFPKTIIPSRKATKEYLGEESDDEDRCRRKGVARVGRARRVEVRRRRQAATNALPAMPTKKSEQRLSRFGKWKSALERRRCGRSVHSECSGGINRHGAARRNPHRDRRRDHEKPGSEGHHADGHARGAGHEPDE